MIKWCGICLLLPLLWSWWKQDAVTQTEAPVFLQQAVNQYDTKLSCLKSKRLVLNPKDLSHLDVFNACWRLYFLDIMLKLEPGTAFIKTIAWLQFCSHSWFPWHAAVSATFYTKPFAIVSKFCNTEIGVGVLAPPFLGRTGNSYQSLKLHSVNISRHNLLCQQFKFLTNVFQFVFPHFHLSFLLDQFLYFVLTSKFPPRAFHAHFFRTEIVYKY